MGGLYTNRDEFYKEAVKGGIPIEDLGGVVESDHMTEFSASLGLYLNLPLSNRFSLGTKFLIGRSFTQELDIDGYASGYVKDVNYRLVLQDGNLITDVAQRVLPHGALVFP